MSNKKTAEIESKVTEFGFVFGSAEVTRIASDETGASIIGLKTPRHDISIRVTKTGNVKVYSLSG